MISSQSLDHYFDDPELTEQQQQQADAILAGARAFAEVLVSNAPQSPGLETALRYIRIAAFLGSHAVSVPL
jgi:hypothetical protein